MGALVKRARFSTVVLLLETIFIVIIAIFGRYTDYDDSDDVAVGLNDVNNTHISVAQSSGHEEAGVSYPNFQDVNVMIFVGFGFLMTFLKNYGFSSMGLNLLLSAVCVQWAAIVRGFIHVDILGGEKFTIGVYDLVTYDFATATVLISFGAVLGKASPVQLLCMALIEILLAQINEYIGVDLLHVRDIGESMFIHMFGAYFGLAVARVLYTDDVEQSEKEGSVYHSDLFAMIGTIFLWVYWPSFNGGFAATATERERAYVNTFLSLCACTVITFLLSSLLNKHGKFDMVHIQNSTLAGGVAVGATANMPLEPYGAMLLGAAAGTISVFGYVYLTPLMRKRLKIHDTCGVHNLHGMPGLLAAVASAIVAAMCGSWSDAKRASIFPETFPSNSTIDGARGRSAMEQGGYQFLAATITLGIALVGGLVTGLVLKLPIWGQPGGDDIFDDDDNWETPEEGVPVSANNSSANHYKVNSEITDSRM